MATTRDIYKIHIYKYTNVRCPCAFSTACMRMISLHFFKAARFWNLDSNHMAGGLETPGLHVRGWGTRLPWHAVRPTAGLLLGVAANLPCGQLVLQAPGWDLPLALSHLRQVGRQEGTTGDSWASGAAVTTAGANSLAHRPPFPLSSSLSAANKGCSSLKYMIRGF